MILLLRVQMGYGREGKSAISGDDLSMQIAPAPAAAAPAQGELFYRKSLIEYPPKEQTADSGGEVEADDRHRYYIKGDAQGRFVRASEWICTKLAEMVGISGPTPAAIERPNGDVAFGSRRIAGAADTLTTATFLMTGSQTNEGANVAGLKEILSSIYAYDMFINNEDRHFGNYLSTDEFGIRRLYAFDYSRALFWSWPFAGFPPSESNTRTCGVLARGLHGFDPASAAYTLDRLAGLSGSHLDGVINEMPVEWLPDGVRIAFRDWWSNGQRQDRVDTLRKGIADGTLL